MRSQFLETGEIVNTHGVRGEVKIIPWADSPAFLCQFKTFYVDGQPVKVRAARVHKTMVLASLEGVDSVEDAMKLKGKVISIARADAHLPEGSHFLADLVGLRVLDAATGTELGTLDEVLTLPAHPVYVVRGGEREYMIPAVPAFIAETDIDGGFVRVNLIEGM
ncbi:MAG: ribosome maturation factor RimM [Clostridiales bacterium]|nr:ribosome maturation factor RimM [Clostridiales bacterium]